LSSRKRILLTGGCGVIGTILKASLGEKYSITCLDTRKTGAGCVLGDIRNPADIDRYFENKDAVIHLAADSRMEADWNSVSELNIRGTFNVFEETRKHDVRKLVFASSNHVTGLYENDWPISSIVKGDFRGLDSKKIPMISHLSPPRSDSFYGVGKLFGEGLGQYFSHEYGMSIISVRIGTVRPYEWPRPSETRFFATWLSHRDLVQLFEKCVETESVSYDVFYGVSNNTWRFWDISHGKEVIGYDPQDNAESHRPN